jgi:hypothetical protein
MNEFDDNEIRDALRRRAGGATDGLGLEAAHSAVVARAGRVRRRRAAAAGGATMAGLIAVAVFVIGPATDSVVTTPADQTDESVAASVDESIGATTVPTGPDQTGLDAPGQDPNATVTTRATNTSVSPATTVPANRPPAGTTPSTAAPAAPTTTVSAPTTTTTEPTSSPPTSATVPSTTATPRPEPIIETYSSAGGSITVRWDGAVLSLQGVAPATGFDHEVEDQRADRIRVRFQGDDDDYRIEIRVDNGAIVRIE